MADIPINAIDRRVQFTNNTGTGPFSFTFNILADSDIAVYKNDTLLTLTTDYTITTAANGTGSVTLTGSGNGTALVTSDFLTIVGGRALSRTTDFVTAGDLLASALNEQLDSNVIMVQQLDEKIERTLRIDQSDQTADMVLPKKADRANKTLGFDSSGLPAVGEEIGDWKGDWAASTTYAIRDLVKDASNSNVYRVNTAHTSSGSTPLSSNANSAYYDLVVDAAAAATSASNAAASATTAEGHADDAEAAQTAAETAQTAAETAETNAQGHENTAQDWAVKTDGEAESGEGYSSKAWANGGTNITASSGAGASKEWAIGGRASVADTPNATTVVDGTEYSAKGYAIGALNRGSSGAHSAKDWASYVNANDTVDGTFHSAKYYAEQASISLDSFDDTYLGHKSSEPTLDNDDNALIDGALFYDTSAQKLKVYDTTNSAWTAVEAGTTDGFAIAMAIAL